MRLRDMKGLILLLALSLPVQAIESRTTRAYEPGDPDLGGWSWNYNHALTGRYVMRDNVITSGGTQIDIIAADNKGRILYDMRNGSFYFAENLIGDYTKAGNLYFFEKFGAYGQMQGGTFYRCYKRSNDKWDCTGTKNTECQNGLQCGDNDTFVLRKRI